MESVAEHLKRLREAYANAPAARRGEIALARMRHNDSQANRLITAVSAAEALARAVVLQKLEERSLFQAIQRGDRRRAKSRAQLYERVQSKSAVQLLTEIAGWGRVHPERIFESWQDCLQAIEYRNVLIHEAVPLDESYGKGLISAARSVFGTLRRTYAGGWGVFEADDWEEAPPLGL